MLYSLEREEQEDARYWLKTAVCMHLIIIAWLYIMLMVSVSYWPDAFGMLWRFAVFGLLPAWLWFRMVLFVRRQPDDQARSALPSDHSPPVDDKKKSVSHH